jgi:hypothetical protein
VRRKTHPKGTVTWAGFSSRDSGADLTATDEGGTIIEAAFDIPDNMGIVHWQQIVLSHRGDAVFRSSRHYIVRDAMVRNYGVARLVIVSPNPPEEI